MRIFLLFASISFIGCGSYGEISYLPGSAGSGGAESVSFCETYKDCVAPEICQEKTGINGTVKVCDIFNCKTDSDCPTTGMACIRGDCLLLCNSDVDCNDNNSCQEDTIVSSSKLGVVLVCG